MAREEDEDEEYEEEETGGWPVVAGFLGGSAAVFGAIAARDEPALATTLFLLALAGFVFGFVRSPGARHAVADTWLGSVGRYVRRIFRLERRAVLITLVAGAVLWAAGTLAQRAAYPAGDTLRAFLAERYPSGIGHAPATRIAAQIHAARPSEDQRYTPAGVFLRYERDIVAVLPDPPGAEIVIEDDVRGFRRFGHYVGDFWGPRYKDEARIPESALAIPDARDTAALEATLRDAERSQARDGDDICYRWDVEVRSGRRKGTWKGGVPVGDCGRYVRLEGFVDPDAGRFVRRGDPGDYSFDYAWLLDGELPRDVFDRLDIPFNEIVQGSIHTPSSTESRAGKGLIEFVGVMPLLAAETGEVPPVPLEDPPAAGLGPLSPVERSDRTRRAEEGGLVGTLSSLARIAGGCAAFLLVVAGLPGLLRRAIRGR